MQPLADLRTGPLEPGDRFRLYRRPLTPAAVSVALLLICLSSILLWRTEIYQSQAEIHAYEAHRLFASAFPEQKAPPMLPGIKGRLESEAKRLAGLSGAATELPEQNSALVALYEVLKALPKDLRYRILEVRIAGNQVYLDGQVRSHGDAESIATALRERAHLRVEAPRTQLMKDQAVGFTLSAAAAAQEPQR